MDSSNESVKHKCPQCFQFFATQSTLKRHIKAIHDGAETRQFSCDDCGKTFKRGDHLSRHTKSHQLKQTKNVDAQSSSSNVCNECGKAFARKDNLLRHARTHSKNSSVKPSNKPSTLSPLGSSSISIKEKNLSEAEDISIPSATIPLDRESDREHDLEKLLKFYETSIDTYLKRGKILDVFNFRIQNQTEDIREKFLELWHSKQSTRIKVNCSPGFILKHKTTDEYRYYHSSHNNSRLFDKPFLIKSERDVFTFIDKVTSTDILEWVQKQRPSSSWQVVSVTNVSFYIWKILGMGKIGHPTVLPDYISNHKAILSMNQNLRHGGLYEDNLCFFRCLSVKLLCKCKTTCLCKRVNERHARSLFGKYSRQSGFGGSYKQFRGVKLQHLVMLERLFKISITVFELSSENTSNVLWCSRSKYKAKLHLNLHDQHFSLIKQLSIFTGAYDCIHCDSSYTRLDHLKRHSCKANEKRLIFPRKCYQPAETIFDLLDSQADIFVEPERRFFPFRITYDIETYMSNNDLIPNTEKMTFTAKHELMSVAVCSNVPGYEDPKCFVSQGDETKVIHAFVNYISEISETSSALLAEYFSDIFKDLDKFEEEREELEKTFSEASFSHPRLYASRAPRKLKEKFMDYLQSIPVVGFNSQAYDLNIMKGPLMQYLHQTDKIKFTIKRDNKLQCIQTSRFKFLDIINYISPGFTYDKYLKTFGCDQQKGFFPYEYIDDISKLKQTSLPPHRAFFSTLKNANISSEEYKYCQKIWKDNKMETLEDFLRWYSFLDVVPFLQAIEKQSEIYKTKHIDMLKDAISLPGLAVRWKFAETKMKEFDIPLLSKPNADLYSKVKSNIVGGPSIVFHRYHESGKTRIRERDYQEEAKLCRQILAFDANALYLWCMMQSMPTGSPIRRHSDNNFKPVFSEKFGRLAWGYLEYVSHTTGNFIQHMYNKGEKRIGQHGLPVDGFCEQTNTVYQVHGCMFHGHSCHLTSGMDTNPLSGISMKELSKDTHDKEQYIKSLGYDLHIMYECHWRDLLRLDPDISSFVSQLESRTMSENVAMTENQIIQALLEERFFGLIECDIHVPENLKDKFSEMQPVFKNVEVTRSALSTHMKSFAEQSGHLNSGQKMLVGSMCGNKILLLSSLAKWYIEHGLIITRVYEVCQYKPVRCFEDFGESVSTARRAGDADSTGVLLAETSKLVGNSVYGKMITNKEKHREVSYMSSKHKASLKVKGPRFISMEEPCEDFFELTQEKLKVILDTPVVLGFAVLQYAKLRMLQFYYDCIDRFVSRQDFQYIEMDTDSAYMALSGEFRSVVRPECREQFFEEYGQWFVRPYCDAHYRDFVNTRINSKSWNMQDCCQRQYNHDRRTPGLFKEEFIGDGIVALNSKTYYCWKGEDSKYSTKGISKKLNVPTKEQFLGVLSTKQSVSGINKGFIKKDNDIYTYSQLRTGLTYFYAKRKVCSDGVTTLPTDV